MTPENFAGVDSLPLTGNGQVDHCRSPTELQRTLPFGLISPEDRAKLPLDVEDAYPLTKPQLGMFFHNELNPASAVYHDIFSFRINSAFHREKMEQAVQRLVQQHPVLRTSFHIDGFSEAMQLVHRESQAPFTVEDLTGLSFDAQEKHLAEWIRAEKRIAFDRTTAPLLRFSIQLLSDKSFQFLISFHHVCLDSWSLAAVVTELLQDYAALTKGATQPIAPPCTSYREFVALEKRAVASEDCRRFWAEKFQDASLQTLPRWPKALCEGGTEQVRGPEIQIDKGILTGLKHLAKIAGVPLKTVLLAAHERVLRLLYGQTDVTSGFLCDGRPEEIGGEKLIGLFQNLLPIRLQLKGGAWLDLVKQTFAAEQAIIPHRHFALAEIQKTRGGRALFEAGIDFIHLDVYKNLHECEDLGFEEGPYFEANDLTAFTTFVLDAASTQLQMHLDYNPNALCREQIEQFSAYYVSTLKAMAADPGARYETFSPLPESEQQRLLVQWNATEEDYPRAKCIHELFEAQAAETPEATALLFEGQSLTYRELNRRANRLAGQLRSMDIGPGVLVGLCVERSLEMVVGPLGILKAGAAYVPLEPTYPRERLQQMISDAQLSFILSQASLLHLLPPTDAKVLTVDTSTAPERFDEDISANGSSESLAYMIYTSGSTGKPKAVQIVHRAVVNLLCSAAKTIAATAQDNVLALTPLSFDIAALELFMPLILGGKITIASREKAADGVLLAALIKSSAVTVMQATPAMWRFLINTGWDGQPDLKMICGGETLTRKLADQLLARGKAVWNFYGPTETTIWSSAWKVEPGQPVSIGRPLANTQLYILDQDLQPLPVGTIGELHIGGDGLAIGYFNRPELTAEKFIPLPRSLGPPADRVRSFPTLNHLSSVVLLTEEDQLSTVNQLEPRLYKTGDLARYLPNGTIECLGRIDHQVKIRGFRIELGEVETVLRQHPGIAEALVAAREDGAGEKRLVGYLVLKNGPVPVVGLRDFIRTKLPLHMVPAQFVMLEQFPLTPNGKIDQHRLPAPENIVSPSKHHLAPANDDEQRLAEIWQEVLMLQRVSTDDNFFEFGGDSLSATRVFARINQHFGMNISLREMFEHPTIAVLAAIVRKQKGAAAARLQPFPRQPRIPQPAG